MEVMINVDECHCSQFADCNSEEGDVDELFGLGDFKNDDEEDLLPEA